jgi:hypothetical protein
MRGLFIVNDQLGVEDKELELDAQDFSHIT